MNARKNRLGRGLDALLGDTKTPDPSRTDTPSVPNEPGPAAGAGTVPFREVPLDQLDSGSYQPRSRMDEQALEELAGSIRSEGLVQPILVRPKSGGRYEILAGHRRWRACQRAGLETIPAVIREVDDEAALAVALIENIQREDLNPIEEATGLKRLMDEFGMTHQQVATRVGRSRAAVTNLLRLLALGSRAREFLEQGEIDMGHARAVLPLPEGDQAALAALVARRGLSVRETENRARKLLDGASSGSRLSHLSKDPDVLRLESELSDRLAAKVSILQGRKKGRLVIEYHSLDELDGILKRIN